MHDCLRFREDWIAGSTEDFGDCESCATFCEDSRILLRAIEGATPPVPQLTAEYWDRFDDQFRAGLIRERKARTSRLYWRWSAVAATAAIAVGLTWGGLRRAEPVGREVKGTTPQIEFVDDHIKGLDPTVVAFLSQSELFLRSFTKIDLSFEEDLRDARSRAKQDLTAIERQKSRAGNFTPVHVALDQYEGFLREIKNVDTAADLADIQTRIYRSGLIANMKAYQPQVKLVAVVRQVL